MTDGSDGDAETPQRRAQSRTRTLAHPDVAAAAELLSESTAAADLVTVFGRCTVDYEGRAASELGPGDRHLMLKPDGSALVHTAEGQQPVNWQPPGGEHECRVESRGDDGDSSNGPGGDSQGDSRGDGQGNGPGGDHENGPGDDHENDVGNDHNEMDGDGEALVVESRRSNPDETLVVRFSAVAHVAAFPVGGENGGSESPDVVGTEADLKERVLADPDLVEPGFAPLATERETPAGAVDVYGEDEAGRTVVLELKRRRVGPDAVGQLQRYVDALERDLHADAEVRGVLVAPSVTGRAEALLAEKGLEFVSLTPREE